MTKNNSVHIPYPVMGLKIENDWNLLTAWCRYLGLGWQDLAARSHLSFSALSKLENGDNQMSDDLKHVAFVMGVKPEQLVD
ncbi:helix-turn-helix transcriptional regulator [Desulfogranum marinum]|uniref:helix-turn-helix domain-containing protein n=1 Tax=Desulfogranum marinum TaxID=453220 RepID=UPI0029C62F8C|nr:helix-turn-helix transcriptional regulator [Desulfogranum marinum]